MSVTENNVSEAMREGVVIPATSKPKNQTDNLKAGVGNPMDERQRSALISALG